MAGYSSNIEANRQSEEQASDSGEQKKPLERVINGLRKVVAATEGLATEPQAYYQDCK